MNHQFTDVEFDAALRAESDSLLPSSGFADFVMAAVRSEACAPPQIPWRRALPGFAACAVMVGVLITTLISAFRAEQISTAANLNWQAVLASIPHRGGAADALWLSLSVLLALLCLALTSRLSAVR